MSLARTMVLGGCGIALAGAVAVLAANASGVNSAPGVSWNTKLFIQNLAAAPNETVISYYTTSGILMKTHRVGPIAPKATLTVDSNAIGDLPSNLAYAAVVESAQPAAVAYNGFDTASPASRHRYTGGARASGAALNYLPDVANNYADKLTTISAQNPQAAPVTVTVQYIERFSGAISAAFNDVIAANAVHYYDTSNLPSLQKLPMPWTGAAVVRTAGAPVVVAAHEQAQSSDQANVYHASGAATLSYLPEAFFEFSGARLNTFVRVQNALDTPVSLRITSYNDAGQALGAIDGGLGPLQSQVFILGSAGLPQEFRGSAVVESSGQVAVTARHASAVTDAEVVYSPPDTSAARAALPFVQWAPASAGRSYRTTVAAMNTSAAALTVTVKYYDQNGALRWAPSTQVPPLGTFRTDANPFAGETDFLGSVEVETNGTVAVLADSMTLDGARGEAYPGIRAQ